MIGEEGVSRCETEEQKFGKAYHCKDQFNVWENQMLVIGTAVTIFWSLTKLHTPVSGGELVTGFC